MRKFKKNLRTAACPRYVGIRLMLIQTHVNLMAVERRLHLIIMAIIYSVFFDKTMSIY